MMHSPSPGPEPDPQLCAAGLGVRVQPQALPRPHPACAPNTSGCHSSRPVGCVEVGRAVLTGSTVHGSAPRLSAELQVA